jgi:hypothetical protein
LYPGKTFCLETIPS